MGKVNYLLEKVVSVISTFPKGKVLDLGCGDGRTGKRLLDAGFAVEACDMDKSRFQFKDEIPFKAGYLDNPLPFEDDSFNCVIFMEVIEHIYNPRFVVQEINRVLAPGGKLIISTPNILNLSSRWRFMFEGSFDLFREPTLDYAKCFPAEMQNMHVIPWRYQELEYLLDQCGLKVVDIHTDKMKMNYFFLYHLMWPTMYWQGKRKEAKAKKENGVDFSRMNKIMLSKEILLGRHLILEAQKK